VSAPIRWEELDESAIRSDRWTIQTIGPRVRKVGDLFAPATDLAQELPAL
jgi:bifunctional non-homologous end joining protein LigD